MSRIAYRFMARGGVGPICELVWPKPRGQALGAWVETAAQLAQCATGIHACSAEQLAHWLHEELWRVELDGPALPGIDCVIATRARLVREVEGWRTKARRASPAQPVAAAPADAQPRSSHLPRGSTALAAFCAAMSIACFARRRSLRG